VSAIGAVQKARLGYYDQQRRQYRFFELDQNLEVASLTGNISVHDGKAMVHAHVTLCDPTGKTYGGHLAPGTIVFACEFAVMVLEGPEFVRDYDQTTGLNLWNI